MGKKIKRLVITTGALLLLAGSPIVQANPLGEYMNTITNTITAQAAETYSDNWKMDGAGTWWYYLNDGTVAKDSWVQDHGEWYLLGSDGAMRTGIFESNGGRYYLLDTVRGTGTYGKLLKNGSTYAGVTLSCDTSADYEGALSQETINSLKAAGVDFNNVPNVSNTKHVSNGQVTSGGSTSQNNSNRSSGNSQYYDGMPAVTIDQQISDTDGDGKLTGHEYELYMRMKDIKQDGVDHKSNIN